MARDVKSRFEGGHRTGKKEIEKQKKIGHVIGHVRPNRNEVASGGREKTN